jgi:sugar phosphate isomerase/epimerase
VSSSALSVQLYSVREAIQEDLAGSVRRVAEIGYTQVEPYNFVALPDLGAVLADNGLTAPTAHQGFVGRELAPIFETAAALGIGRVIDPHIADERWTNAEDVASVAADLNAAAKIAADKGVKIGYHNHSHEIANIIDGRTALEVLADHLDPEIGLEFDAYWAVVGGKDPVALLGTLGERVVALHVKDGPGTRDTKAQVAVGSGTQPIRAIIEAAPKALRVVELDDSNDDRFQALADSYAYLVREGLA